MIPIKKSLIIFILFALSSCNGIVERVEGNLVNLEKRIEAADSLLKVEFDKIQPLDTLMDKQLEKMKQLNRLIQDKKLKLDTLLTK